MLASKRVHSKLIPLPDSFNELVIRGCNRKCKETGLPMKEPALCLLCGAFVCVASPCCTKTERTPTVSSAGLSSMCVCVCLRVLACVGVCLRVFFCFLAFTFVPLCLFIARALGRMAAARCTHGSALLVRACFSC